MSDALGDDSMDYKCCICGGEFTGWGNNPEPVVATYDDVTGADILDGEDNDLLCCDDCNSKKVIPARMQVMLGSIKYER